jgi:dTDP-4-dehydrorhamnose 3,5-epimerase
MKIIDIGLQDALLIEVDKYLDNRGFFIESYNEEKFGLEYDFVQDNHSMSHKGVLRGLHYQIKNPQGKLVRCIRGSVYDVIVDLRESSETFGEWYGVELDRPELQLWVPPGFAHGFYTRSDKANVVYKTTDFYYPEYERTLLWNDLTIDWNLDISPILSDKDQEGKTFQECEKFV